MAPRSMWSKISCFNSHSNEHSQNTQIKTTTNSTQQTATPSSDTPNTTVTEAKTKSIQNQKSLDSTTITSSTQQTTQTSLMDTPNQHEDMQHQTDHLDTSHNPNHSQEGQQKLIPSEGWSLANRIPQGLPADVRLTLKMFTGAIVNVGHEIIKLANEWDDKKFQRRYEYVTFGDIPLSNVPFLPKHVLSLPKDEAFSSDKIGKVAARAHEFLRSQMPLIARLDEDPKVAFRDIGYDIFKAFFGDNDLFPMPRGILSKESDFWKDDECFADQYLNGCNPTIIEKPKSMEQVNNFMPKELFAVCDEYNRSIEQLFKAGELYWADYSILTTQGIAEALDKKSGAYTNSIFFDFAPKMTKYFYAPFVAFYKNKSGRLRVLGIVLTRSKTKTNFVYNAKTCISNPNIYVLAKMHVACADNQLHQFYFHLGRCHLVFEPFGVAVRNVFKFGSEIANEHAVGKLLQPHFHDHMAINWLARNTLIAHGDDAIAFTDAGFALGKEGGVALLAKKYRSWKLEDQAFPVQLEKRGFNPEGNDGLDTYYYRTDGMRIWKALRQYVQMVLEAFYRGNSDEERDAKIAQDEILDAWCDEMRDPKRAFVPSFPAKFKTLDDLCQTITTIIYNVSAEHAAVNASQKRYLAYVPNRPNALFRPVPPPNASKDMKLIEEILGIHRKGGNEFGVSMPVSFAMFQVQFAQLLTLPPTRNLMQLDDLKHDYPDAYEELMAELEVAHYLIKARNMKIMRNSPHLIPYEFLDPEQISLSIEI